MIDGVLCMPYPIVLSYMQAESLLTARKQGQQSVEVSPDLGISMVTAKLSNDGVEFPRGEQVSWQDMEKIKKATVNCFVVENGGIRAIQVFSEDTNRMCSLLPTKKTPSMLIAGFTMHRIVDIDPMQDTLKKIATIAPISGRALDTATGLGYTAIEAAKTAEQVITIELDPGAQEIAQLNPWSGELYSGFFYQQLYRVLKRGGRLFHYIGNLESKSSGTMTRGALKRLQEAGFARVVRRPEAFGVVAYK